MSESVDLLADRLAENFVLQKDLLLQRANARRKLDHEAMLEMVRPKMDRLAHIVKDWDIAPDVLMEAVFAWARSKRHPDGPMVNMLYSVKYLSQAVGYHLEIPYEVVMEKRSLETFLEIVDEAYAKFEEEMRRTPVADLSLVTSFPIEFRYLWAMTHLRIQEAFFMSPDVLNAMEDRRTRAWLKRRGILYEKVAAIFNAAKAPAT